jgi:SAM-dependent methyltransferase
MFFEVHSGLPREAPGDDASTVRALRMMDDLPASFDLLDIACGPGGQTVALATHSPALLTAVDTHQPFLDELVRRATAAGVADRITPLKVSMFGLDLGRTFDVVWSEGAVYMLGFEAGLRAWRSLLKPRGYVAVTELSWLKAEPPREVLDYWLEQYPGVGSVEENLGRLATAGYEEIGHFTLPENSWWDSYYHPMERRVAELRGKYQDNPEALQVLDTELTEVDIYRRYSEWYGYVFYIMRARQ